ncbi:MAG: hypothetical protein PVJ36_00205 [Nitrospirota bacterium]|jgi:hypothetical protein
MVCSYADLDSDKLKAVQDLEKKLGKTMLAFSCQDINSDALSDSELAELREAEKRLGLSLLAVK